MKVKKQYKEKESRILSLGNNSKNCVDRRSLVLQQTQCVKKIQQFANNVLQRQGWDNIVTNDFLQKHVGNEKEANIIAQQRGDEEGVETCHVLDYFNIAALAREVGKRVATNNHGALELNPQTGHNQYYTNNSYKIYETKYTNGKAKRTKSKQMGFYYDAPVIYNGRIHHFDGPR